MLFVNIILGLLLWHKMLVLCIVIGVFAIVLLGICHNLIAARKKVQGDLESLNRQNNDLNARYKELNGRNIILNAQYKNCCQEIDRYKSRFQQLKIQQDTLQKTISMDKARIANLEKKETSLTDSIKSRDEKIMELMKTIDIADKNNKKCSSKLNSSLKQIDALNKTNKSLEQEKIELMIRNEEQENSLAQLTKDVQSVKSQLKAMVIEKERISKDLEAKQKAFEELALQLKEANHKNKELESAKLTSNPFERLSKW